jgi:hypothetical protein
MSVPEAGHMEGGNMVEDELRRAAEALRADLPDLIDDLTERAAIEADLTQALDQPPGAGHDALRKAIGSHSATRDWMRRRTPVPEDRDRAIGPLGQPTAVLGVLFVCPNMDYSFMRERITDEVPLCPHDGSVLQRQDP